MSNRASMEVTLGGRSQGRRRNEEEPVRILVLGDFSGRGETPSDFKPRRVTFESIDDALGALKIDVAVDIDTPLSVHERVNLQAMDDFHPDAMARHVAAFRTLKLLRQQIDDPAGRDEALARLAELMGVEKPEPADPQPTAGEPEGTEDTFERLLGAKSGASPKTRAQDKVQSFIDGIMAGTATESKSVDAEIGEQQLDLLVTATMRAVLASEPLRSIERSWRGLDWLVRRLDDETAEIWMLDLSKHALAEHTREHSDALDRAAIHRLISEPTAVDGWDLVIGDYTFQYDVSDLALMATMGAIASKADVRFLAHGDLGLAGCNSLDKVGDPDDWWLINEDDIGQLWIDVRQMPSSQSVGLATPRMLLRQPYGAATDPIDAFEFEELAVNPDHEAFCWGNPAYGVATLLALDASGQPQEPPDIDDMPPALYEDGTGQALKPQAEAHLRERAINQVQASGLIAMVAHPKQSTIRCPYTCSISIQQPAL